MTFDRAESGPESPTDDPGAEAPPAEAPHASTAKGAPRKKRRGLRRWLLGVTLVSPLLVALLWVLVHRIPWMGPLVANTLRSVIGVDNVARLEDFVYAAEDRVNRTLKKDEKPKAHWQVPETPAPDAKALVPSIATTKDKDSPPPFSLQNPGPMFKNFGAAGDGTWIPITDPRKPEDRVRLLKTLIHPDESRGWSELFVVAVDLSSVEVKLVAGYQEPRTEKKEAEGYVRRAKIPESDYDSLLGAFNGGFMAEHGHYGFLLDGITFLDPKEESCTLAFFRDGHYEIRSFSALLERRSEIQWFRQAPSCMYENGEMHASLRGAHQRKWGATLDGNTVIRRSAVGISSDGKVLFVGITNHTTAKVLARGMHHAGSHHVAQMDVNWSYPKFVTYEPDKSGRLVPKALAEGFEFNEHLYLRERSMRDFFYLVRKPEAQGSRTEVAPGSPGAPEPPAPSGK